MLPESGLFHSVKHKKISSFEIVYVAATSTILHTINVIFNKGSDSFEKLAFSVNDPAG